MISFPLSLVFTSNTSTSTFNKYRLISALLIGTLSENREKNHVKLLRLSKSLVFMLALPAKSRLYPRHCNVPNSNHIPSHQPVELNSVGAMNATISLSFTVTLSTNREKRERELGVNHGLRLLHVLYPCFTLILTLPVYQWAVLIN